MGIHRSKTIHTYGNVIKIKIYSSKFVNKEFWSNHDDNSAIKHLYPHSEHLIQQGFQFTITDCSYDEYYRDIEIYVTHHSASLITWLLLSKYNPSK